MVFPPALLRKRWAKMRKPRQVFIAIPSYAQKVSIATSHSLMNSIQEIASLGATLHVETLCNDALIARARNTLFAMAYEKGYDDLIFIDDDLGWEQGAMKRLLQHPVDCVGGLYPIRREGEEYLFRWDVTKGNAQIDPMNGLLEVDSIPTGFLRLTKDCIRKMIEAYPQREYLDDSRAPKSAWAVFDCMFVPDEHGKDRGRYWGEDFVFCQRWRHIGGKVWCDPWLKFKHVGEKAFTGCFGTYKKRELLELQKKQRALDEGEKHGYTPIQKVAGANQPPPKQSESEVVDRKEAVVTDLSGITENRVTQQPPGQGNGAQPRSGLEAAQAEIAQA